ncbi:MAG: glycosyltransferase family 4 protein, partial [Promethearchaeota archaeon]
MKSKILVLSTRIFPDIGGVARQVHVLSTYLSKKNIGTIVIASSIPNDKKIPKINLINKNFEIHHLPLHAPGYNASSFKFLIFFMKFFIFSFIKAVKLIKKNRISFIHAHSPPPTGFVAYLMSKIFKIPYSYSIHGLDYPNKGILNLDMKIVAKNATVTFA